MSGKGSAGRRRYRRPGRSDMAWWIDPVRLLLFLLLPLFVLSAWFGGPMMAQFGNIDFLMPNLILLGALCIATFALGAWLGTALTARRNPDIRRISFDPQLFDQVHFAVIAVAAVSHVILLAPLMLKPGLMLDVVAGVKGANFAARMAMLQIVGLTSFTHLSMLAYIMASVRFIQRGAFTASPLAALGLLGLVPLILIHGFMGSERLVLVENAIAFLLPLFAFWPRLRRHAAMAPLAGLVFVLAIFALGEYQRSWAFYEHDYDSFPQFVTLRFFAYVAGAANTGAGMVATADPNIFPEITNRWMSALFIPKTDLVDPYFDQFGNIEFNNPSGIYAAIADFGTLGILYILLFGVIAGILFRLFILRHPVGLLAYPVFFIGFVDLTQIWYWGEPRFIPQLIALLLVLAYALRRRVHVPVA